MIAVLGAMGHRTVLSAPPRRVVSLVPSETEAWVALGGLASLVGRTDYCVTPASVAAVTSVGGTKDARLDDIVALAPDLVLCNQEENTEAVVRGLARAGVAYHLSFPKTVRDAVGLVDDLARLQGLDPAAVDECITLRAAVAEAEARRGARAPLRVFCPIWMDPLMTVHGDTFISDMLDLCGGYNVFSDRPRRYPLAADRGLAAPWDALRVAGRDTRYPRVTLDELVAAAPELVLLPDEPHPFSEADAAVFRGLDLAAARDGRVLRVPGRHLSWYSTAMAESIAVVTGWIDQSRR